MKLKDKIKLKNIIIDDVNLRYCQIYKITNKITLFFKSFNYPTTDIYFAPVLTVTRCSPMSMMIVV